MLLKKGTVEALHARLRACQCTVPWSSLEVFLVWFRRQD